MEELNELQEVLEQAKGLGRDTFVDIPLGGFAFKLCPLSSEMEIEAYSIAEEEATIFTTTPTGKQEATIRLGPSYVQRVKQEIVLRAIYAINGVLVERRERVLDAAGEVREVEGYLRSVVMGWGTEVINYMHIKYNQMIMDASEKMGYQLPHRMILSVLDRLLKEQAKNAVGEEGELVSPEELTEQDVEEAIRATQQGPTEVQGSSSPTATGVSDQDLSDRERPPPPEAD